MLWSICVLLSILFFVAAHSKFCGHMSLSFHQWNYSLTFMIIVGFFEGVAAIMILIPGLRKWSAYLIITIMLGAAYTHFQYGEIPQILVNLMVIGLSTMVIWYDSEKSHAALF